MYIIITFVFRDSVIAWRNEQRMTKKNKSGTRPK